MNEREKLIKNSEIYMKALDLFVKNGYDATSMSEIADTLGMSKANLYYYCSSKENLLYQIHLDFLNNRFIPILERAEKLKDPAERIAYFLREFTLLNTSSRANRILVHEVHRLDKNHRDEILDIWKRAYLLVKESFKELQRTGRINKKFRESFLTFMWAGMAFWVVYWFDYSRQINAEELADTIAQTFLSTLTTKKRDEVTGKNQKK